MVAGNPIIDIKAGGSDIYDDIIKALDKNGDLTEKQFRRLVLLTLVDLGRGRRDAKICREGIEQVNKRIDVIEKYTLLLWMGRHPKGTAIVLFLLGLFVFGVVSHLELWGWIQQLIEQILGVPLP